MNKVLIATRNKDKFRIVTKLLKPFFDNYNFYNLDNINEEFDDKKENGDVINRSFEKAKNVYDNIKNNDYEYIIGVDDGIKIKGEIKENVKDYVKDIIEDKLLKQDEIISIVRAYTFFNKKGEYYSILTEIPFKYKRIEYHLDIKSNTYPLSYVLRPLDLDKAVAEMNDDESNKYYFKYSEDKFKEAIYYFKK